MRGTAGRQVVGQPRDALDVEVVGRLVQQQQVGVGHEQLGQGQPPALAAGHRADDRLEAAHVRGVDAAEQPLEDVTDARVAGPDVLGQRAEHRGADRGGGVEGVDLRQHAAGQPAEVGHAALVDLLAAGEHLQQGGLAATVAADDADAAAGVDAEGDVVEDEGGAEGEGRPLDGDEVGHDGSAAPGSVGVRGAHGRVPLRRGWRACPARAVGRGRRHRRLLRPGHRAAGRRAGAAPRRHRWRRRLSGRGRPRPVRSARLTEEATPEAVSPTARSSAASWSATRNATVGPDPETTPPRAPHSIPVASTSLRPGCSGQRRLLQVVGAAPGRAPRRRRSAAPSSSARTARARAPAPAPRSRSHSA